MKSFRYLCTVAIAILSNTLVLATWAGTPSPEKAIKRIEGVRDKNGAGPAAKTLEQAAKDYGVPGYAIAVIADYKIQWVKPYGMADEVAGTPVTKDTLFQAASISKPVSAMASVKAAQDGLFSLDADINTILRSWHVPDNEFTRVRAVTPRMLMSHTSGTDDRFGFPGYEPGVSLPTLVQVLNGEVPSNLKAVTWAAAPFTRMKYSGGGVIIMMTALQDVTSKPFEEFARTTVLEPIGMKNSFFVQPLPAELDARAARSHFRGGAAGNVKYHVYPELAAAGLWTTPEDLAIFAIEVQKTLRGEAGRVLTKESAEQMVTPVGVGNFGVGFATSQHNGVWYFEHSGGNWGVTCDLIASRDAGVGFAIMTNAESAGPFMDEVQKRVAEVYDWPGFDSK